MRLLGLGVVGAAAVALAPSLPDPDKLKWVPGAKSYFDIQKTGLRFHDVAFSFSSSELAVDEEFARLRIEPAIRALAEQIDREASRQIRNYPFSSMAELNALAPKTPFLTADMVTRESLEVLEKNLAWSSRVNKPYVMSGAIIGDTVNIRFPQRFDILYGIAALRPDLAVKVRS